MIGNATAGRRISQPTKSVGGPSGYKQTVGRKGAIRCWAGLETKNPSVTGKTGRVFRSRLRELAWRPAGT